MVIIYGKICIYLYFLYILPLDIYLFKLEVYQKNINIYLRITFSSITFLSKIIRYYLVYQFIFSTIMSNDVCILDGDIYMMILEKTLKNTLDCEYSYYTNSTNDLT